MFEVVPADRPVIIRHVDRSDSLWEAWTRGCWAKLDRASVLICHLAGDIKKVKEGKYLRLAGIGGRDGVGVHLEVLKPVPADRWAVQIGEIVHDLRSALDHAAWACSVAHSGPPPNPPEGPWRRVEFPIFTRREDFHATTTKGKPAPKSGLEDLQLINPALVGTFDAVQPYHSRVAERHPLAILGRVPSSGGNSEARRPGR